MRGESPRSVMRVRLLFFGLYREFAGTGELEVEVRPGATVASVVRELRARGGGFARLPEAPVVAVNHAYAGPDVELANGDEVAILPPVAGG